MSHTTLTHRNFATRYLALLSGEVCSKLCLIAAFGYLARVLTPTDYGIVEQALLITVFFVLAVESGTGLYGARVVAATPAVVPQLTTQVMALRGLLGVPAFGVILAVAAYYHSVGLGVLAVNGLALLLMPFQTQWVFQGLRQMPWVAAGTVARNLTFVAIVLALVRPGGDIRLVAAAEVSGIVALALVNAYLLHGKLRVRLDASRLVEGTRRVFNDVWFMGLGDLTWACLWYAPVLVVGRLATNGGEQVAWIAAAVRIVMAIHTFVFLYFFNLLPNLSMELAEGLDRWQALMRRSMVTSMAPACLIAVGGTLFAPILIPLLFGEAYRAAVRPFQIAIWMIPATWFSGHFRFSLIAAGHQWWMSVASAVTAVVTVVAAVVLSRLFGSVGAAAALLLGGVTSAVLSVAASHRYIGPVPILPSVTPALMLTMASVIVGAVVTWQAGVLAGGGAGCLLFVAVLARQDNELRQTVGAWFSRQP